MQVFNNYKTVKNTCQKRQKPQINKLIIKNIFLKKLIIIIIKTVYVYWEMKISWNFYSHKGHC